MGEIWKQIDCYETYSVSTFGQVRNDVTGRILKSGLTSKKRLMVILCQNSERKNMLVHRLVAQAFISNPECKKMVDHIDNNPLNNSLANLRWATSCENQRNSQISITNTSGIKGVTWNKRIQKWIAQINLDGKRMYLGCFTTIEDATCARQAKANEIFGAFMNSCEKSLLSH